jgi:hypothetical protein
MEICSERSAGALTLAPALPPSGDAGYGFAVPNTFALATNASLFSSPHLNEILRRSGVGFNCAIPELTGDIKRLLTAVSIEVGSQRNAWKLAENTRTIAVHCGELTKVVGRGPFQFTVEPLSDRLWS